jgi:hypothetical protein
MSPADVERAARVGPETARETAADTTNSTTPEDNAQAGKSLAFWLFNIGARCLDETDQTFSRHPEWRSL